MNLSTFYLIYFYFCPLLHTPSSTATRQWVCPLPVRPHIIFQSNLPVFTIETITTPKAATTLSRQFAIHDQRGAKSSCTREVSTCLAEGAIGPSVAFLVDVFPSFPISLFPLLVRGRLVRLRTYLVHIISPRNYTLKTHLLLTSPENGVQNRRARYAM